MSALPKKLSHRAVVDAMFKQNMPMTAIEIQAATPCIKPYKPKGLSDVMADMVDAGYVELTGEEYSLTQATADALSSAKFKGAPAAQRESNVFATTMNPVSGHVASLRRALSWRLA